MKKVNNINQNDFEKFKATLSTLNILNETDFELAREFLTVVNLSKKEHFININQKITHLAFITKGVFRSYYINDNGNEISNCFCLENEFIYVVLSSVNQHNSPIAIQAIEPSELITISFNDLNKLYSLSKNWLAFTHQLTRLGISESFKFTMQTSEKEASEKYTDFLKTNPGLVNRIPMKYLASYLGISIETLSRVRKKLTL